MIKLGRLPLFLTVAGATIALHRLMKRGLWWGVTTYAIGLYRLSEQGVREMWLRANRHNPALMFSMAGEAVLVCQVLVKGYLVGSNLALGPPDFFDSMASHTPSGDGTLKGRVTGHALIIQLSMRLG